MKNNKNVSIISVTVTTGILAIFVMCLVSCTGDSASKGLPKTGSNPVPVTVTRVIKKEVSSTIDAIGNVKAYNTVTVKPQIDGILSQAYFEEGKEVSKGDMLLEIDPRPFKAALDEANAELAKSKADLSKAKADMKRYDDLIQKGIASREQYDQVRTNLNVLTESVKSNEAKVQLAELQLDYCYIHSPINGRIGKLLTDVGNVVKKSDTELVVINQIKPIYVEFSVPEQNLDEIKKYYKDDAGLEVYATSKMDESSSNSEYQSSIKSMQTGKLNFINNQVDTNTGTILLKAVFPNDTERFWPGQFVRVQLELHKQHNALVVPTYATLKGQSGDFVFIVNTADETVEPRNIVIDRKIDDLAVVTKGLRAGDTVVTNGQLKLAPGTKVEIKTEPANQKPELDASLK